MSEWLYRNAPDLAALWFVLVGVWPFADPGHGADTPASVFDLALHVAAAIFLIRRWKVQFVRKAKP